MSYLYGGVKELEFFDSAHSGCTFLQGSVGFSGKIPETIRQSIDQGSYGALQTLREPFSIASWNACSKQLTIARDHSGINPIYYYFKNGVFLFASQLKMLMESRFFGKKIDKNALGLFLQYGYIPAPYTIFCDCHKLLPGHVLTYNAVTNEVKTFPYWDVLTFYNAPRLSVADEEALENIERLLLDALGDEPEKYGAFLSGGYDSSLVVALLKKKWGAPIRTFAVAFEAKEYNEAPFAREVAQHLGTDHSEFLCTLEETTALIHELPELYDEPFADSSAIPSVFVCRQMREAGIEVAFSGDGGDEIFGGYFKYCLSQNLYSKYLKPFPFVFRKITASLMGLIPPNSIPLLPAHVHHFAQRYTRMRKLLYCNSPEKIMQSISQAFSVEEIKEIFLGDYIEPRTCFDLDLEFSQELDSVNRMMAIDYKTYLAGDGNTKVERAAFASDLKVYSPMLVHGVIEYMALLPSQYKIRGTHTKWLLKELTHRYIPKEIMDRPKKGFAIPVASWLRGSLKTLLLDYLDADRLKKQSIFSDVHGIIKIRDEFIRTGYVDFNQVWFLLMFQMWHERWMR